MNSFISKNKPSPDRPQVPHLSLQQNIAFRMGCIVSRMDRDLRNNVLRSMDLTYVHFRMLQVLYDKDGQVIGDLARTLVLTQPTVSRIIDQMEERKLATRSASPEDSRFIQVWLTKLGRSKYEEAWPDALPIIETALEAISSEERGILLEILLRIDVHLRRRGTPE